jgi:hypothetical protein
VRYTRAVWKVRGLALVLRVGTLWRCGDGLFFEAMHWIEFWVRLGKSGSSAVQSRSRPMRFLGFCNYEKGAPRQEISKWLTFCNTFSRSGWSAVRSASLSKGRTSRKRLSPHRKVFGVGGVYTYCEVIEKRMFHHIDMTSRSRWIQSTTSKSN